MSVQETTARGLNGHTSLKDKNNSDSLIEREKIKGTPFEAIKQNNVWFLTWGNYRLSPTMETLGQAEDYLTTNLWDVIAVYTLSVIQQVEKVKEEQAKQVNNKTSK